MFLNYKTSDGHRMQTAYCGLQKSLRSGSEQIALYWAGQIGKSMKGGKGYPNALKKRLCQNALEDAASWTYASRLLEELPNGPKLEFEQLIPWVKGLAQLSKTHSTAWLNRVAAQHVYDGFVPIAHDIDVNAMDEVEFAAACLQSHSAGDIDTLKNACLNDGDAAIKLYKFVNCDPLVFHAWQMHQRRPELRDRAINLQFGSDTDGDVLSAVLQTPQELPLEWFDKHTKEGKKMGRGYAHFFEIMELHPRVYSRDSAVIANACVRGGNDPYESEAKDLYLDFKLNGSEARVRHLLDPSLLKTNNNTNTKKRVAEGEGEGGGRNEEGDEKEKDDILAAANKKQKQQDNKKECSSSSSSRSSSSSSSCEYSPSTSLTSSDLLQDRDVFDIPESTGLIGFKNFTVIGVLRAPLRGLELCVGDRVFVKMGESYDTCMFAVACDDLKGQLGMVSMRGNMAVEWLLPTYDVAELVSRTNPLWVSSVTKRMNKAGQVLSNSGGALPTILMRVFEGYDLCQRKEWLTDGMELLKVLLFRKYVGAADTNGKNMMVSESGQVFSVDETVASAEQLARSRAKGLVTAQSIHVVLLDKAAQALCDRPKEVATFIEQLKQLRLPAIVSQGHRLSDIHSEIPFNEATTTLLLATEAVSRRPLEALAKKLKLK